MEVVAEHSRGKVPTVDQSSSIEDLAVLFHLLLLAEFFPGQGAARVHPTLALVDLEKLVPEGEA